MTKLVTLAECPPGAFMFNGHMGFKTEYRLEGGRTEAYCMSSGECFIGGAESSEAREELLVYPVNAEALYLHCAKFKTDQRIDCSETVYQTDRVIQNAYEFIDGVCEIIGYPKDEDEEGDE
jgi:hypothetical protein